MGGYVTTGLHFIRSGSGAPATEVFGRSNIDVSSARLGWKGVVAERGTTPSWSSDDVALAGHAVVINLDAETLRLQRRQGARFIDVHMPPGSLWITPAGAPMTHQFRDTCRWGAVELSAEKMRFVLRRELEPRGDFGTVDGALSAMVRALLDEATTGGSSGSLFIDQLTTAIAMRLACHAPSGIERVPTRSGIGKNRLSRVTDLIEGTLESAITVGDLAAVAGLSPAHFARAFKRETNETPHAFVMRRRIERARELMASGTSIAEAALGCGFTDQAHLSRVFKLRFGMTPGVFVRSARGRELSRPVE
jgi:AraC family transcriptional regulator